MEWVFLLFAVATVLMGGLAYLTFRFAPKNGSGGLAAGFVGAFFVLLGIGGFLGCLMTGGLTIVSWALPDGVNANEWSSRVLIGIASVMGVVVLWQRRSIARYPQDCYVSALLYWPCIVITLLSLVSGIVLAMIG
jgi:hypothetical protein